MSDGVVLRVRRAGPADATIVRGLMRDLAAEHGSLASATSTADVWRRMLGQDDVVVLLANMDSEQVGYVSAVRTTHLWTGRGLVVVDDLYVAPGWRHRGIGTALVRGLAVRSGGMPERWEMEEGDLSVQRFSLHMGARLRRRVVAWRDPPEEPA